MEHIQGVRKKTFPGNSGNIRPKKLSLDVFGMLKCTVAQVDNNYQKLR